jgi:uncharacterized protein (TIGR00255 family)
MIYSMTAFARASTDAECGNVTCEIRSVNSRYLESHFKLPDALRAAEGPLRELLRNELGRGKVEVSLRYQPVQSGNDNLQINQGLAQQIINAATSLADSNHVVGSVNPIEILRWPGVMQQESLDEEALVNTAMSSATKAVADLKDARAREGEVLATFISSRLDAISDICEQITLLLPEIMEGQRQRLQTRLAEVMETLDAERVEQEMVILLQRADVDEELDRLKTHVGEVKRVLKKGGHCGRRLDFLMQELNREANTLSSKSQAHSTTQHAVELKVLIEQMREQIQNIE